MFIFLMSKSVFFFVFFYGFRFVFVGSSPMASLTIATGQPVMMTGQSVVLQLETEESLMDWECKVYRREKKEMKTIKVRHNNNTVIFQPKALTVPETIFWCISRSNHGRSNQVVVRTSGWFTNAYVHSFFNINYANSSQIIRCETYIYILLFIFCNNKFNLLVTFRNID